MFTGLTGWHAIILLFVFFLPWLVSVIQIGRTKAPATPTVVWLLVVTLLPLVGPILWWAVGRGSLRREAARAD